MYPIFLKHFKNVLFLNRTMKDGQKNYKESTKNTGQIGDRHQSACEANTTQWKGKTHTITRWKDKDLYYNKGFIFKVSKRVFFFEVSFSWYCISRGKETTCIESHRCCFLIIRFFTKRLLSSFHKAASPLDLRIGMLEFPRLSEISKFFLIFKLTQVWRNYPDPQPSCGPKHRYKESSLMVRSCVYLSNAIFKMRVLQLAYICFYLQNLWVMPSFIFFFNKNQNPDASCKL